MNLFKKKAFLKNREKFICGTKPKIINGGILNRKYLN